MDAEFSDEQEALRTSVRRFLDDHADLTTSRGWFDRTAGDRPLPREAWQGLADLGLVGMLVPAGDGGSGGGLHDLGAALEELGRVVVPGPFISTAVAGARILSLLGTDDQRTRWLGPLVAGSLTTALVLDADISVSTSDGTSHLVGRARHVLDGADVDLILVVVPRDDDGHDVLAVEASAVAAEAVDGIDPSRRIAHLTFSDAVAEPLGRSDDDLIGILDQVHVALVLDALGSAEASLALAVAYAQERRQFGAAIGSFQAVQHLCADMLRDIETVRGAAYHATWALDAADRPTAHHAATVARAIAAEALPEVGAACIQVHGGIGFTWEHDAHRFYKRQLSMAALVASAGDPLDELADLVLPA